MAKRDKDTITLGSGEVFITEYDDTLPEVDTICVPGNLLGHIKGGAALEYTAETYEEKDDLGKVSKIITTSEDALLKLGLITWNGATLVKLVDRGKTSEAAGKRITKIGGAGNATNKNYVVCFKHTDPVDGNVWVLIVGKNTAGFTLTFGVDEGTKVEPEFKALPHDTDGTLVQLIEEIPAA